MCRTPCTGGSPRCPQYVSDSPSTGAESGHPERRTPRARAFAREAGTGTTGAGGGVPKERELSVREIAILDQIEAGLRAEPPVRRGPAGREVLLVAAVATATLAGVLFLWAAATRSSEIGLAAVAVWVTAVLLVSRRLGHGPGAFRPSGLLRYRPR